MCVTSLVCEASHFESASQPLQLLTKFMGAPYDRVVRQTLDRKSKLCPVSVQTLSNCPNLVQSLSNACQMVVQIQCLSKKTTNFVKCLSKLCPSSKAWTEIGHSDPEFVQTLTNKLLCQHKRMDNAWTNFRLGQSLDKL